MESIPERLVETIREINGVNTVTVEGTTLVVGCENPSKGAVVHSCYEAGTVTDVETSEASLEDLFVSYTGGES